MKSIRAGAVALLLAARLCVAENAPSIDQLVEQLGAREVPIRREAATQLAKLGAAAKPALPTLITALGDSDKQVWSIAIGVIASLGPDAAEAIPTLLENLDSRKKSGGRDRDRRQLLMRSAYALTRIGPAAKPALLETLKSEDGMARMGAARALGGMGPAAKDAVPALVENLRRDHPDERRETIDALGQIGPDAAPLLGEALDSSQPIVRAGAALALAQIGRGAQSTAAKVAEVAARETDPAVRAALLSAVAKVGVDPARAVELLIAGVKDDNEAVRHGAINAIYLLRSANGQILSALTALLADPNGAWSERAAVVVGRLGPSASAAIPTLLAAMRKRTPAPPVYLDALAQIGPAAVPGVLQAIEKENPDALTREHWSVKCLQKVGGGAVAPLTGALGHTNLGIRLVAARTLGELGPVAAPAFNALTVAAADADPRVRATAIGALVSTRVQIPAAVSRVEAALKDPSAIVRIAAAQLIPHLGEQARPLAPALINALGDSDAAMQLAVVQALPSVGQSAEPAIRPLLQLLPKADNETRARVLAVFAGIGSQAKEALPEIQNCLKDSDPAVRAAAFSAVAKIEEPAARLPILLAALDDPALPVRKAAAQEIAALGDKAREATGRLVALLGREDERDFAFDTLRQISPRSVPDLVVMLGDRDLAVKGFAARRLGSLGPEAREAIPALEAILNGNERGELKRTVAEALKRIKP